MIPKEQHALIPDGMEVIKTLYRVPVGESGWIYPAAIECDSIGHLYVKQSAVIYKACEKPKFIPPSNYHNNVLATKIEIGGIEAVVLDITESGITGWERGNPAYDSAFTLQFGAGYYPVAEVFQNGVSIGRFIKSEILTSEAEELEISSVEQTTPKTLGAVGMIVSQDPTMMNTLRKFFKS